MYQHHLEKSDVGLLETPLIHQIDTGSPRVCSVAVVALTLHPTNIDLARARIEEGSANGAQSCKELQREGVFACT